ncbi:CU044_5270 family protein [Streptomyces sp. 150FB]|uniref:CU044_5270 family protein n=1 Tax=Streptomyces sp. 150FB TaxID=1576605 RepID=UPI000ACE4FDB|nr:CU044_5270 family protein [Streptomyces sp. 150FB]
MPKPSMRAVVIRITVLALVNVGLPTLAFILLPPWVGVVPALVVGTAIPALFVLIQWPIRKKLDPIGALAAVAYGIGLLVFVASGENPFVLKIQEAVLVGPVGIVLLISAIAKRPLLMTVMRYARRRKGESPTPANDFERRLWQAPTAVLGSALLVNALTTITLAFTLSTSTFLIIHKPVAFLITLAGIVIAVLLVKRRLAEVGAWAGKAPKRVTTTITGVRVFDGTQLTEPQDVSFSTVFENGDPAVRTDVVVDGSGATLLPGLIDAHTHTVRGRDDLASLARWGATTALDMATWPAPFAQAMRHQPGVADLRTAGTPATGPGGHHAGLPNFPKDGLIASPDDAASFVARRVEDGVDYVKIILDGPPPAGLSVDTAKAVVAEAHRNGLRVVAHAASLTAYRDAVAAGVDILTHVPMDGLLDQDDIEGIAGSVAVVPTLVMMEGMARTREDADYASARENVRRLHRAGVRILAGTDANAAPGIPWSPPHGASLHHELELLVDAGLTPAEAIASATTLTADTFALGDRGRVEVGLRGDAVLVHGDPTADIGVTRDITHVWIEGNRISGAGEPPSAQAQAPVEGAVREDSGQAPRHDARKDAVVTPYWKRRGVIAVVAVLAVAAGVVVTHGNTDAGPAAAQHGTRAQSASGFLNDVAEVAATQPTGSGKYWKTHLKTIDVYTSRSMQSTYVVAGKTVREGKSPGWRIGARRLGWNALDHLPTNPASLVRQIENARKDSVQENEDTGTLGFVQASTLLASAPASPELRGGLFRALAQVKGVSVVGTVKDSAGRSGTELAFHGGVGTTEVIVDPKTSTLLELVAPWRNEKDQRRTTYLSAGLTDRIG